MGNVVGFVNFGIIKFLRERMRGIVSDIHLSHSLCNFHSKLNLFVTFQGHEGKFTAENFAII